MLYKMHFIYFLLFALLFNHTVSATFEQKLRSIRKQYPRVHPYEPTNESVNQQPATPTNGNSIVNSQGEVIETLNHLPVNQQPRQSNKSITVLPDELLQAMSDNLDFKSNFKLGKTNKILRNTTQDRRNLHMLQEACGKRMYWSLMQNGHSIFSDRMFEKTRLINEQDKCIQAIILNHSIVKSAIKHFTIHIPTGYATSNNTLSYLKTLDTLFNKTEHLESITIKSEIHNFTIGTTTELRVKYEALFFKIVSNLNVSSIVFETRTYDDDAFSRFARLSSLRSLKLKELSRKQAPQLQYLRNLESITLLNSNPLIDFALLKHLRHVDILFDASNLASIFDGQNGIQSINADQMDQNLERRLKSTSKKITSLTIDSEEDKPLSFQLLNKFKPTLKHLTIIIRDSGSKLKPFLTENKVLESIKVYASSQPMEFLNHTKGLKHFAFCCDFTGTSDQFLIHFIKREKQLESLSISLFLSSRNLRVENMSTLFLTYLDQMSDAILVQKSVKEVILNLNHIRIRNKHEFSTSFYKTLSKLGGLDLTFNGVPIKNVLRDLRVIDDDVFEEETGDVFKLKIIAREMPLRY